jgi:phage minor structural protein
MLSIAGKASKIDNYYIDHSFDGENSLCFDISKNDALFPLCVEGATVIADGNQYIINKVSGSTSIGVECVIDTRDFKALSVENYDNTSATLQTTMAAALPSGWSFVNTAASAIYRTVKVANGTKLDIVKECAKQYDVAMHINAIARTVTAINPKSYTKGAAFVTEQLNLRSVQYFGDFTNVVTRLFARGKDGMTFASINGGKDYVENYGYTNRIIVGWLVDERYTNPQSLLDDCTELLLTRSKPTRSYECDVVDLKSIDPAKYAAQDLSLYQVISLKDIDRNVETDYQVVQVREYPYYPEKNVITLSTAAPKLSTKLQELEEQIDSIDISGATDWLTGNDGGYMYMVRNAAGQPTAMVWMDALTQAQSTKATRYDQTGIKYGSQGALGNFTQIFDIDGAIWRSSNYAEDANGNCTAGTQINLSTGEIKSVEFTIDTAGNATFKGDLSAAGGTFKGDLSAAGGSFKGTLSSGVEIKSPVISGGQIQGATLISGQDGSNKITVSDGSIDFSTSQGSAGSITPDNYSGSRIINIQGQGGVRIWSTSGYYMLLMSDTIFASDMDLNIGNINSGGSILSNAYKQYAAPTSYTSYDDAVWGIDSQTGAYKIGTGGSMRALKHDIRDLQYNGEIHKLRPREFKSNDDNREMVGFIAEEMDEVCKHLTSYDTDGKPKGVQYSKVCAYLVAEAQQAKKERDALEKKIAQLEKAIKGGK